ncbi:MAG: carbamoyltransferase HypF [Acidobacteria bacterium]|nr:carbamoyltransferase HypF [Acidobacteriota bacterium]
MTPQASSVPQRARLLVRGAVQGVGFRPFVYRLAREMSLAGFVQNTAAGVLIEVEGEAAAVALFQARLLTEKPMPALIHGCDVQVLQPSLATGFVIHSSSSGVAKSAGVQPDLALCAECRAELLDRSNRRYHYPFLNCTHCGPRYSVLLDLPYDRPNTTMREFALCPRCRAEYDHPSDRRFHAQPNACPECGPMLSGTSLSDAAWALSLGLIVALKGIGGFQLLTDARDESAVARLRLRKHREAKPLALMLPSLDAVRELCFVSDEEAALLESPAAPVVLLRPRPGHRIAPNVAGPSAYFGVMLPYSPLHHLLMSLYPFPIVATSGNRSEEPIATGNDEAMERLGAIADCFVLHNRPIARPCDDSVARIIHGAPSIVRRARGYAPAPVAVEGPLSPVLATGGHLKNTVAIALERQVVLSQHIGDLESPEAREQFERTIHDLSRLYDFHPEAVACDLHPDYASTLWASRCGLPVVYVQHHEAHIAACAAENLVRGPYLGVAFDGAGLGRDSTIWGGEFFGVDGASYSRIAHLRPFPLPGGEAAIREGWRAAAGLWFACGEVAEVPSALLPVLTRRLNSPLTSSVGRLFDAVASILGLVSGNAFEGHAAMSLERCASACDTSSAYPLADGDWRPMIEEIRNDLRRGVAHSLIAARFHNALAVWIGEMAHKTKLHQVVLSGGVFQNRYLTERVVALLESQGHAVFVHRQVPANDGGLALGQAVIAGRR